MGLDRSIVLFTIIALLSSFISADAFVKGIPSKQSAASRSRRTIVSAGLEIRPSVKSKSDVQAQLVEMNDYEMPIMNEDLEDNGLPVNVVKFVELVKSADAVVISTPEYNGSIPPLLKNVIDWLSRPNPHAWLGKPILLMAASPGDGSANSGQGPSGRRSL